MINLSIVFLTNFVTFLLLAFFMMDISNEKNDLNFFGITYIICIAIINTFFEYTMIIVPMTLVRLLFYYTICRITCNQSRMDSLINSLVYFIVLFIAEIICLIIQNLISNIDSYKYVISNSNFKDLISIIVSISLLYICNIKIFVNIVSNFKNACYKRKKYIEFAIGFFITLLFFIIIYVPLNNSNGNSMSLVLIAVIILIFIIFFFIAMFNNYKLKNFNNYLINLNDTYEKILNDYKMFKHNIKHEFTAISNIGDEKVKKLINEYIEEYDSDCELKIDLSNMPVSIKGIIHQSMLRSKKINTEIKSNINIFTNYFDNLNEKTYLNICESLGIIIDNALEAISDRDYLYIEIKEFLDKCEITCINNFTGNLDLEYFGFICKSSKDKHMGIGIQYLISKNKIRTEFKIINNKFHAKLIIKK